MEKSIQIQTVLYNLKPSSVYRTIECLARSFELAKDAGALTRVRIRIGDTSSVPSLSETDLAHFKEVFGHHFEIDYVFFDKNLGSARGHNTLAEGADTDYLMILNPDVVVSPRTLERMLQPFSAAHVGMTEARQIPIEHPKDYDPMTGETGWATTACAVMPTRIFREVGGFDAESFFLYCDDVDYSWLTREAGYKVIYLPHVTVFHDKRLDPNGGWLPSSSEVFFSAQAALMIAHKWSYNDVVEHLLKTFKNGTDEEKAACKNYLDKKAAGTLVAQRDTDHRIGSIDVHNNHNYTRHRYKL